MLLPASILNAALHFLFPSSRLLAASFRRDACYFHPTSYSHSLYCILTQPSTFYFHPPSHFPLPSSALLRFPDFILHAASFYILPFLDAASYFHPSCCFPHCFSFVFILHIASFYRLQSCMQHPVSILQAAPTSIPHIASYYLLPRCIPLPTLTLHAAFNLLPLFSKLLQANVLYRN